MLVIATRPSSKISIGGFKLYNNLIGMNIFKVEFQVFINCVSNLLSINARIRKEDYLSLILVGRNPNI